MDTQFKSATETGSETSISYMPIVAAVGGFLAFVGVFLGWFKVAGAGTQSGTDHWTGTSTVIVGAVLVFAGIFLMVTKDSATKRTAALVTSICGILCVVLAGMAFAQMDSVYSGNVATSAAFGLYASLVGGLIGAVAGIAAWSSLKQAG